jgi:prepilin-type N-terminal cleavage/methylation domain-containing protein
MGKKAFTLTEILIVVVIIGILVSIAVPTYQYLLDQAEAQACQANLDALQTALDIYAMENEKMPGSLGELPVDYLRRAYVKLMQRRDAFWIKLAYFMVNLRDRGLAYAASSTLIEGLAKGQIGTLTRCPAADKTDTVSYGFCRRLKNMTSQAYQQLSPETILIADSADKELNNCNKPNNLKHRHRVRFLITLKENAQFITRGRNFFSWDKRTDTVRAIIRGKGRATEEAEWTGDGAIKKNN